MTRVCDTAGVASVPVRRVTGSVATESSDDLSVEEPLAIVLVEQAAGALPTSVAVTMRTPGDDAELAAGFLFTEGIITGADDLESVEQVGPNEVLAIVRPKRQH